MTMVDNEVFRVVTQKLADDILELREKIAELEKDSPSIKAFEQLRDRIIQLENLWEH